MNAVMLNNHNEFELGLTAIIGAAIFEFTIGFAIGCLLIRKNYKISFSILTRDILIYLLVLVLLYFFLKDRFLDLKKVIIIFFFAKIFLNLLFMKKNHILLS